MKEDKIQALRDELAGLRVLWDWALAAGDTESADNINKQILDTQDLIEVLEKKNSEPSEP